MTEKKIDREKIEAVKRFFKNRDRLEWPEDSHLRDGEDFFKYVKRIEATGEKRRKIFDFFKAMIGSGLSLEAFSRKTKNNPEEISTLGLRVSLYFMKAILNLGKQTFEIEDKIEKIEPKDPKEIATLSSEMEQLKLELGGNLAFAKKIEELCNEYERSQEKRKKPKVKAGLHLESQKFGTKPPGQITFEDLLESLPENEREEVTKRKIEVVGVELTVTQTKALHAIQALLSKTDYKGNIDGAMVNLKSFNFEGTLPRLEITPAQFLEAYGLEKRETTRGFWEYSPAEREAALQSLWELRDSRYIFSYKQLVSFDKKTNEKKFHFVRTVSPILGVKEIYEDTSPKEDEALRNKQNPGGEITKKLKYLQITASPVVVDQHETYFVLKEADYLKEIELKAGKVSSKVYLFIDWLIYQANRKQREGYHRGKKTVWDWTLSATPETLQYTLKMDSMIKNRNPKRIKVVIAQAKKIALELGYLESFDDETVKLNPERFHRLFEKEEVKEMIGRQEAEEGGKAVK